MLRTRLTDALQIEHPVMLAGMGGVSYHRLVTAVSDAGGFGCMGASTMSAEDIRPEIAAVTGATDKPFGVDLLPAVPQGLEDKVRDIIAGGATAFVAGLGVPRDVVDMCHASGLLVVNMCGKVRHAVEAVGAIGDGRRGMDRPGSAVEAVLELRQPGVQVGAQRGDVEPVPGAAYDETTQMTQLQEPNMALIDSDYAGQTKKADREVGEDQKRIASWSPQEGNAKEGDFLMYLTSIVENWKFST